MVSFKGLICRQVHLRPMTVALWENLLPENVRKDLKTFLWREIVCRNDASSKGIPDIYTAKSIEESCVYNYYLELPLPRDAIITGSGPGNNDEMFDAFMFTPQTYKSSDWKKLWHTIPDHLWFDPPERQMGSSQKWAIDVSTSKSTSSWSSTKTPTDQRKELVLPAYDCMLQYPVQKYSAKMNIILDRVERLLSEKIRSGS